MKANRPNERCGVPLRERAQTIMEFALIAPFVLLFLFLIVDFGISLDRRIVMQHAVREGARFAAVTDSKDNICDRTFAQAQGLPSGQPMLVTISYEDGADSNVTPGDFGDYVRVAAAFTYEFPLVREILGFFGVGPISVDMTPAATARLEQSVADTADYDCPAVLPVPTVPPP